MGGGADRAAGGLRALLDELPEELASQVFRHASWTERSEESYERLAFLGDSVLGLAVSASLYPSYPSESAGGLTKIRAQAVSGPACARVAGRLGLPDRLRSAAPAEEGYRRSVETLISTERALASVCEAAIGACYLAFGYERTAEAVRGAFTEEVEDAVETPTDPKSALQELLARRGATVEYRVTAEEGPPHDMVFTVEAVSGDRVLGEGSGRSKKAAERDAAAAALLELGDEEQA